MVVERMPDTLGYRIRQTQRTHSPVAFVFQVIITWQRCALWVAGASAVVPHAVAVRTAGALHLVLLTGSTIGHIRGHLYLNADATVGAALVSAVLWSWHGQVDIMGGWDAMRWATVWGEGGEGQKLPQIPGMPACYNDTILDHCLVKLDIRHRFQILAYRPCITPKLLKEAVAWDNCSCEGKRKHGASML